MPDKIGETMTDSPAPILTPAERQTIRERAGKTLLSGRQWFTFSEIHQERNDIDCLLSSLDASDATITDLRAQLATVTADRDWLTERCQRYSRTVALAYCVVDSALFTASAHPKVRTVIDLTKEILALLDAGEDLDALLASGDGPREGEGE